MRLSTKGVWIRFGAGLGFAGIILLVSRFREFIFPPPPSYSVAVLGALAVVMTLVLPKEPSKLAKAAWMFAAFSLMAFEMWAVSHDRKEQDAHFGQIVGDLTSSLQQGNEAIERLKIIANYVKETPGIPAATAAFITETAQVPRIAEDQANTQALRAMAPGLMNEMEGWTQKWRADYGGLDRSINEEEEEEHHGRLPDPVRLKELRVQMSKMNADNSVQILPMMKSANFLRQKLLENYEQTEVDMSYAAKFDKVLAGQTITWVEMQQFTGYMESLILRKFPDLAKPQ
jgi:hypothetical protein